VKIGIIGGGIAGLTAAYKLGKSGHDVSVFEKKPHLGGQVATFDVGGERLEGFYHHIFTNDIDIIRLIDELELSDHLVWLKSKSGFFHGGRIYDFVTPGDLLRFSPVTLPDRVRLGLVSLFLRRYSNWRRFEGITAREWLIRYGGRRNYDVVWGPLLKGKFGASSDEIGMVWLWGKIYLRFASRSRGMRQELLGYMEGSYGRLVDSLAQKITDCGGEIHTGSAVSRVVADNGRVAGIELGGGDGAGFQAFDAVIATVPSPVFLDLVSPLNEDYAAKLRKTRYQAVVCLVLVLRRQFSRIYWLNISDSSIPFVAAIEHTNFVSPSAYGGKHVLYLSNYLSKDNRLYGVNADELLEAYMPSLKKINPEFESGWIEECHRSSDDYGQPIVGTHYSKQIPEYSTPIEGLFLANTTQIYPEDRGMNYSVRLGNEVSIELMGGSKQNPE
jgi:protoporphyrinogen oxidase